MKAKDCILTSVHLPFDTRIFHKEAKSLVKAGYDVTLIAQHDKEEVVDGIRIFPLSKPKNRIERMTRTVWSVYRKALEIDADIYHFHDPELIPIGLMLKHQGKQVIYDVHEDAPRQNLSKSYIPKVFRGPISVIIDALEAFFSRHFDGVVTATPFINKRFIEIGATAVNVNNYPLISELYTAENQWNNKEKVVCYVGVIARIRGAFEMVEAISKTPYRLLFVGNIKSEIEMSLKQMPGWRQVDALGFVDRDGVRATTARSMAGLVVLHPTINSASTVMSDNRTGRNIQHNMTNLLRQSVYNRLAGYEDVNDDQRLSIDPVMRAVTGKKKNAASINTIGRFKTEILALRENLDSLSEINGRWVQKVKEWALYNRIILDLDSSESPVHGEQEGSAYNGHFESHYYHPLICFNQYGDCEGAMLRPGNVHSADRWKELLEPVIQRYEDKRIRKYFRGDAAFA